ncbi:MAG: outer membrane protein assembly factor BamE [Deltaproteobacteria bacterium]|nr:outer membrane protein assembly factor BamE [Deltaproteobacteria bacterium]
MEFVNRKLIVILVLGLFGLVFFGCSGAEKAPAENNEEAQAKESGATKATIPPECPLAKIKEGMGQEQVMDILGPPKDQEMYTTGKQWIPFYFGSDVVRTVWYYKGLGQIHFNRGRVLEIMYDPTEDGYR